VRIWPLIEALASASDRVEEPRVFMSGTAEERSTLDRALDAYDSKRDPGRPAEEVIAEIKKKL
jgi:hypothetical protein